MTTELIFKLGISSVDAIRLYPDFDFQQSKVSIKNTHRAISGRARTYIWAEYDRFELPVDYVSGNNAAIINSWWLTDTQLLFFKTISITSETGESGYLELVGGSGGLELMGGSGYLELVDTSIISTVMSSEVFSVYIVNNATPLKQFNKPYDRYYRGSIELEGY